MRENDLIVASGWEGASYVVFEQYGGEAWLVNSLSLVEYGDHFTLINFRESIMSIS